MLPDIFDIKKHEKFKKYETKKQRFIKLLVINAWNEKTIRHDG